MSRIENEKKTVELMIRLYCRRYEKNSSLCADCIELLKYAEVRLDRCKFGEKKPDMRERMRRVMRWAGPRMIFYYPLEAIKHLIREMF